MSNSLNKIIEELKEANSDCGILLEENEQLKQENEQLKKMEKVNRTKASLLTEIKILKKDYIQKIEDMKSLADENFKYYLEEQETNDYIDELKQQLFNAYLKQQHDSNLIAELKLALSSYNNFVDEMFPD